MGTLEWAVALLALFLSGVGVWLTVAYGKETCELLRKLREKFNRK